jgi:tRNA threonylcarbamoyladenosine biosynthesis protein TsaB
MWVMGIDTATQCGGVALLEDERTRAVIKFDLPVTHSLRLMPAVDLLLRTVGISPAEIEVMGVVIGPGSFTGLRIGLSVAKGLAFGNQCTMVGIKSLEALAWGHAPTEKLLCPVVDARRGEVYAAGYRKEKEKLTQELAERVCTIEQLVSEIQEEAIFMGNGALRYQTELQEALGARCVWARPEYFFPSPEVAARLAYEKYQAGKRDDPLTLEPFYVRRSDAELRGGQNK